MVQEPNHLNIGLHSMREEREAAGLPNRQGKDRSQHQTWNSTDSGMNVFELFCCDLEARSANQDLWNLKKLA